MPSISTKYRLFLSLILLCVLVIIGGSNQLNAQYQPVFFKLDSPKLVEVQKEFAVSLITSNFHSEAEKIQFNVVIDDGLKLEELLLNFHDGSKILNTFKNNEIGSHGNVRTTIIDLQDDTIDLNGSFQLLYKFSSKSIESAKLGFSIYYIKDDKIIGKYSSIDEQNIRYRMSVLEIEFFESKENNSKETLLLEDGAFLNYKFNQELENDLLIDFWGKIKPSSSSFFRILDTITEDTLLTFSNNRFGILRTDFEGELVEEKEKFVSPYAWNFFAILYSRSENSFNVFLNDSLVTSFMPYSLFDAENLTIEFESEFGQKNIYLHDLRIWDFGGDLDNLFLNKNYNKYSVENSKVIVKSNNLKNSNAESMGIKTSSEHALPIFSNLPEINVVLYSNFYSVEWSTKDSENAKTFIVEKSTDGSDFIEVYETSSSLDNGDIYTYSDAKEAKANVVYYRIKQINKDGSFEYTNSVKVGSGEIEEFLLNQNYPNPFNPVTTISIDVFVDAEYEIRVYDVTGKMIKKIYQGFLSQGTYNYNFDASEQPSGIYFCEVKTPATSQVRKMILAK